MDKTLFDFDDEIDILTEVSERYQPGMQPEKDPQMVKLTTPKKESADGITNEVNEENRLKVKMEVSHKTL